MSDSLQLQVIDPTNQISYYPLDPECISVTIGAAPTNDIQLQDAEIAELQFVLDLPLPRRVMALSDRGNARLAGENLPLNEYKSLEIGQRIEVGRSSLILLETNGSSLVSAPQPQPEDIASTPDLPIVRKTPQAKYSTINFRIINEAELRDDVKKAKINTPVEWQIDLENTSQRDQVNERRARFFLRIEGDDPSWATKISPQVFALSHTAPTNTTDLPKHRQVRIETTPRQSPTTYAGICVLTLSITSAEFGDDKLVVPLTIDIAPYSDYEVSSLSRAKLQVRSQRSEKTNFTVTNKGNHTARFEVTGHIEDLESTVELLEHNQVSGFDRWVETSTWELKPTQQTKVQARVQPKRRYWFGNAQRYPLIFTIKLLNSANDPKQALDSKSAKGELTQTAWFRYLDLLWVLFGLVLLFFVVFLLSKPSISKFIIVDGSPLPIQAKAAPTPPPATPIASAVAGTIVELDWQTKHSPQLAITRLLDNNREEPLLTNNKNISETGQYTFTARNGESATYILRGTNWIANLPLIGGLGVAEQQVRLNVAPVIVALYPMVDTNNLVAGQPISLSWSVSEKNAQVTLFKNDQPKPITGTSTLTGTSNFMTDTVYTNTTYQIQSQSAYPHEPVLSPLIKVKVLQPAPVPASAPEIRRFEVMPPQLIAGQKVTILYDVSGADALLLLLNDAQVAELQPPAGQEQIVLPEAKRYRITLKAVAKANGAPPVAAQKWHTVEALPPLPAPQIQMFKVLPESVERGSDSAKNVTLAWSLTSDAKNIRILTPDKLIASNLPYSGTLKLSVDQSTNYQILADGADGVPVSKVASLAVTDSAVAKGLQKQSLPPANMKIQDAEYQGQDIPDCADNNLQTDKICTFKIDLPFPVLSVTLVGVNSACKRILWKQWRYDQIDSSGVTYQCRRCEEGTYTVYAENADGIVTEANYTHPKGADEIICK